MNTKWMGKIFICWSPSFLCFLQHRPPHTPCTLRYPLRLSKCLSDFLAFCETLMALLSFFLSRLLSIQKRMEVFISIPAPWQVIKIIKQQNFFPLLVSRTGCVIASVCVVLGCLRRKRKPFFFLRQRRSISTFYNICVLILQISFFFAFKPFFFMLFFTVNLRNIARRPEN